MVAPEDSKTLGRPSDYTDALSEEICGRVSEGQSMRKIAKDDHMPSCVTMFAWLRKNESFLKQYEIAKAECADMYAEEIIEISDDSVNDYLTTDEDGKKLNPENIQRARLKVDARKWVASKLKPKKYGDRLIQETKHTGVLGVRDLTGMTDEELQAELDAGS